MFLKLGIIVGIVVITGVIFASEINVLFPNTSATAANSLKDDVKNLGSKAVDSAGKRIEESFDAIVGKTNDTLNEGINNAEEKITSEISETKESSQAIITENINNFNPIESIQNIFASNTES
ncbi:MAG: hypothetical protein ACR2LL_03995 [Nitrosopumilus sp.]|uniref:hypothetical protein n=1 Tax=Nitrosopumilus sp. TaxID=2024843 RepID=UPI00292DDF4F|nr:hypothetical protein [Nitrosopumilus sp.]